MAFLCALELGQTTAVDWDNNSNDLVAQVKPNEAIHANKSALEINPQDKIALNNKANAQNAHDGRAAENYYGMANWHEEPSLIDASVLDHSMATSVNESDKTAISRTQKFSAKDSKAYSWLSLGNVGDGTVYWNWYSPSGQILFMDSAQIPLPVNGSSWNTYNIWSSFDIVGENEANRPGDWHVDVFLDGRKMLTEYFSISGDQKTAEPESQYQYNLSQSDETAYKNLYNQDKYYLAITKGDNLKGEGRYDEAIHFYDEAINSDPNNFQNWKALNSKGEALFKQGKYEEALQAYDKAIELAPDISIVWTNKGYALKALGRTNESDVAYASARELGDQSAWVPETNATGINLTSLYFIEILDHCMANDVDKSTNNVTSRTSTFSGTNSRIYSWLNLGHVLGAAVTWHWYSPDGNPYKTGQVNIDRNPKGGYWPSYKVWYGLDVADIPKEQYMSGNWHVDVYINGKKRLAEQFDLDVGSGTSTIGSNVTPGSDTMHGTFNILDHCMASEIDQATDKPVTTTKTDRFSDNMMPYSWLQLENIGVARVEWHWYNGEWDIKETYNIPPNPSGGYYTSYSLWDYLDIPSYVSQYEDAEEAYIGCINENPSYYLYPGQTCTPNAYTDPHGDWTIDIYVNDHWLLQEQFTVLG